MIKKISLKNVRKFKSKSFLINSEKVILSGLNAAGKTTVLEAISLTSITKSHRTNYLKEIILEQEPFADIKITADKEYRIVLSNKGKVVMINNIEQKKLSDYIGKFPSVFFSPNDLEIVFGSPSVKRQFINQEISQISTKYLHNLNLYNKLLQERNSCLKEMTENSDTKILDVITNELIEIAKKIISSREKFIEEINKEINEIHQKLNENEQINLIYQPSVTIENIEEVFKNKKQLDITSHQTNYGVHRDDVIFCINGKNAAKFASQGQQRTLVLALKLGELEIIKEKTGYAPILLLDDVLAELDETRQNYLLKSIEKDTQTIITSVDTLLFEDEFLKDVEIYTIKNGQIKSTP